jgi:opacity protein-like surface antigen
MKQKTKLKLTLLAAVAAVGLTAPAFAQEATTNLTPIVPEARGGLLGYRYSGAEFTYDHVAGPSPSEWRGFALDYNQPLAAGFDFNLAYGWKRASDYQTRLTQQDLLGGVTAYSPLEWGKPFVQALAGWEWRDGYTGKDHSFVYQLGTGVEFQVASAWVVTPYVNFVRATSFNRSELDYGVKMAYRLTKDWSLTAGIQYEAVRHAKDGTGYMFGVNYHY